MGVAFGIEPPGIGIDHIPLCVEIDRRYVQWLMDVADIVGQKKERFLFTLDVEGCGDGLSLQGDGRRLDRVHNIVVSVADKAGILVVVLHGDVGVVVLLMAGFFSEHFLINTE